MSGRLLLDTHAFLWWLAGTPIGPTAAAAIADPSTAVSVSAASVWEIAIKRRTAKLRFDGSPVAEVVAGGFEPLAVTGEHAELAGSLPDHHRDPFDRMLVAQATIERLTIVSRDQVFARYGVSLLGC